jgi:hypothetical protein
MQMETKPTAHFMEEAKPLKHMVDLSQDLPYGMV